MRLSPRYRNDKTTSLSNLALDFDCSTVEFDEFGSKGETDTCSFVRPAIRGFGAVEAFEDVWESGGRDAASGVSDGKENMGG